MAWCTGSTSPLSSIRRSAVARRGTRISCTVWRSPHVRGSCCPEVRAYASVACAAAESSSPPVGEDGKILVWDVRSHGAVGHLQPPTERNGLATDQCWVTALEVRPSPRTFAKPHGISCAREGRRRRQLADLCGRFQRFEWCWGPPHHVAHPESHCCLTRLYGEASSCVHVSPVLASFIKFKQTKQERKGKLNQTNISPPRVQATQFNACIGR
jgi:hypothetical protein